MKKSPLLFILMLSVTLITVSCKKKEATAPEKTTLQKLQGKWTFVSKIDNEHISGKNNAMTTNGKAGDYWEFINNKLDMYAAASNSFDHNTYNIIGDNTVKLVEDNISLTIQTLTDHDLKLYVKEGVGANKDDYKESTFILSK